MIRLLAKSYTYAGFELMATVGCPVAIPCRPTNTKNTHLAIFIFIDAFY